jgi:EAL domain-containing protein (putative c-di-GMP-specific phosphodiesterase class I)
MATVTAFVLEQALADCAGLREAGYPLRMSVNVSATDLIDSALPERVLETLAAHRLDPSALVVEVTEDTVMADRARSLQVLLRLREVGVGVSVDDYGTGHSSLSYLRDLPISELKLDRSFLQAVPVDTHNAAIVRSTVQLAHALGLPIVAEGVEDAEALGWLRDIGCDIGQGFHLCRPLPMDELRSWLPSHAAPGTGAQPSAAAGQRSMSA